MADNPPTSPTPPPGAEPMKKTTGKVAPKKETVSINLPSIMASMAPATPPAASPPGTPPVAVPPMKKETGKVQPKKETVRINLPPKPSAAPTIKLPTLPPGGPTGAPTPAPAKPAPAAPRAAAPAAAPRTTAPAPQKPAAAAATVGTFDKILAIAAMVAALFAVGTAVYFGFMFNIGS